MITDRNLEIGAKLTARYKGDDHSAELVQTEAGPRYRLADGRQFKSPSAAGTAILGGACNGWVFWSVEGTARREPKVKAEKPTKPAKAKKADKPTKPAKAKKAAKAKATIKKPSTNGKNAESYGCGECGSRYPTLLEVTEHVTSEHAETHQD